MRFHIRFLAVIPSLLCGLLIGGCAVMKSPHDSGARQSSVPPQNVDGYLAYYRYASSISGEELKKEYMTTNQAYIKTKSDASRLQLGLLLSLPNSGFRDDSRALTLLREFLSNKANESSQLKDFALLLSSYIAEHKRQEEKLKTEQSRNEEQEQRLEGLKDKLKMEQSRGDELEQKLEALKGIEKSISERQQSQPGMAK